MSKTIEQLRAQAAQIEEATRQGENTQIRVGGLFTDVIDFIAQIPITETVLGPLLQALNNSQLIDPSDGQTLTFSIMKDGWTFSDALTQLKLSINGIEQTVTSNYEAFLSVKDQLQREVAATDQRVRNYKTDYDNSQIEYATWKSQTDTQISQYAVAIDKNTGDIISISGRVDTAYDQLDFVTNDLEAADKAIGKIFDLAGMNLSDEPSASWLYKNKDGIYGAAATFDAEGNIKNLSKLSVTINGIETEVSNATGQVSTISQTVDQISLRVSELNGKYSELKIDVNGISATVNDPSTGIGALNVKADRAELKVTTLEGQVATMGVKMITVDNIQRTLAEIKANVLDFDFTDEWVVRSNGTEVMRLDTNGNLSITGTFYGQFPDGMMIGNRTSQRIYVEDGRYGARLIGKRNTDDTVFLLGFNDSWGYLHMIRNALYTDVQGDYIMIGSTLTSNNFLHLDMDSININHGGVNWFRVYVRESKGVIGLGGNWARDWHDVEPGEMWVDSNNNVKVRDS